MLLKESSDLLFHYYLKKSSHEINALTRNTCEKEMLLVFQELCDLYSINSEILSTLRQEGGIKDFWRIASDNSGNIGAIAGILALFFSIYTHYDNKESEIEKNAEICLKKLQIQSFRKKQDFVDPEECLAMDELSINGKQVLIDLNKNKKTVIARSNFFKTLSQDKNIEKFASTCQFTNNQELITNPNQFHNLIIPPPQKTIIPNDSIEISLISPVFRERKYKWRGLVEDSVINFKISDRKFNKLIKDTKFPFRDGDVIQCAIKTKGEVDYFGDWVKKEIFITKVHALVTKGKTYTFSGNEIISTGNSAHESQYNQGNLFEDDDFFDINRTEI